MKVEIVVGANYGDEGKGLFTDFLCRKSSNALVVLSNGGCQRGHTVNSRKYGRNIFHHFGSGTFQGAPTYYSPNFILNPMAWVKEKQDIEKIVKRPIESFRSNNSRFQFPFDIGLNRLFEDLRGEKRHGSVGSGIYETFYRYSKCFDSSKSFSEFLKLTFKEKVNFIKEVQQQYVKWRIAQFAQLELGETFDPDKFAEKEINENSDLKIFLCNGMIEHFCQDCEEMGEKCEEVSYPDIAKRHDTLIFEQGQGLRLDPQYRSYNEWNDTTPSHPGTCDILKELAFLIDKKVDVDSVTVNYISRTYLTKHGAGYFKVDPTIHFEDLTNIPNPYQGTMRFGKLDYSKLFERINRDFSIVMSEKALARLSIRKKIAFTHVNEIPVDPKYKDGGDYFFETEISEDLA